MIKRNLMIKRILGGVGLFMLVLVLTSCEDFTGGGWIVSASDPNRKAHFGFIFHCENLGDGAVGIRGSLQYNDTVTDQNGKPQKLSFHGVPNALVIGPGASCELFDAIFGDGRYTGDYTPQPQNLGAGGTFDIQIQDLGQKGPSKEDIFTISLSGGVFNGYSNSGTLEGGQITLHQ